MGGDRVPVMDNSNDGLLRAIEALERKLDTYVQSFQDRFLSRSEYQLWQQMVDSQLKTLQEEQRSDKQWEHEEHTKLANAVVESERRIIEKLDEKSNASWGTKLLILSGAFGWIMTLALAIIGWFLIHH